MRDGGLLYYGSADGTSWFLVLLAALGDEALAAELEPAWRAAGGWLERALDAGGGLVRHGPRGGSGGLAQQGWRDALDPREATAGASCAPTAVPAAPLADADTQAVAHAALRALARLPGGRLAARARRRCAARDERVRAGRDGARGRRPRGAGGRLPARMAAVGRRARGEAAHAPPSASAAPTC